MPVTSASTVFVGQALDSGWSCQAPGPGGASQWSHDDGDAPSSRGHGRNIARGRQCAVTLRART